MRFIKHLLTVLTLSILRSCKVTNSVDIQTTPPFEFLEAPYFQSWLAGCRAEVVVLMFLFHEFKRVPLTFTSEGNGRLLFLKAKTSSPDLRPPKIRGYCRP